MRDLYKRPRFKIGEFDNSERKLKPCPFCGQTRIQILPQEIKVGENTAYYFSVSCFSCSARINVMSQYKAQIISSWNCRAKTIWINEHKERWLKSGRTETGHKVKDKK